MTSAMMPGGRAPLGRFLFSLGVLLILCLFCAPLFVDTLDRHAPSARDGVLTLPQTVAWNRAVGLGGQWRLVWRAPALAGGPQAGDTLPAPVPGVWEGLKTARGAALPKSGLATYELTVRGLPAGGYILFVPTIFHASRVWINGRVVSEMGRVGATRAETTYLWRPHEIPIQADGEDLRLTIDVAAFRHSSDGLEVAPSIGPSAVMDARLALQSAQQFLFIITLIILFFYGAVVFSYRSNDFHSLYFALSCLCLVPTAMVIGHENLLILIYPGLSFGQSLAIEYLTGILTFMFLLAYTNTLFPRERLAWVYWTLQILFVGGLAVLSALLAEGNTFLASQLDRYPLFAAAVAMLYIVGVVLMATLRRRDGAAIFLLGMTIFGATVIEAIIVQYDILPVTEVPGYDLAPMGIVVFSFCHLIILAERWSLSIRATEALTVDLRRLMEVSTSIASEIRLEVLLRKVVEAASKFLQADRGTLFLHDPKTDTLWSVVAEGEDRGEIRMASDSGLAGASFQSGEASIVNAPYADPRFNRAVDEATGYRTEAVLTLPIATRDGRRLGVMQALNRRDGRPFDTDDLERMRAFAAHAAVAIDNAALFADITAARNYNESILASMSGGVITLGAEGRIETLNAAAGTILEVEPGRIVGLAAPELLTNSNAWLLDEFQAVREDGRSRAMLDIEIRTAGDRQIAVNLAIVPLINNDVDSGLLILFEDISQEKRMKSAMRRFMTQRVVDQVLDRQDDLPFGSSCVASVLFADIRGFTSLAERLAPRETVDMLNEVFTEMVEAVNASDGVVDKFIGDAVMAVFGAPISSGRDPQNAVQAASGMMRLLAALNARRGARGEPPLRLGVGVATGELIAGAIGSPKRMDYTVIGDCVNLASRVQDLTKAYGVGVILCETTAKAVAETEVLRRLDTVAVRGRDRPETLYQLLTYLDESEFPHAPAVLVAYDRGLNALRRGDSPNAAAAFAEVLALNPNDRPAQIMMERAMANLMP